MQKRYLYVLLFVLPALLGSVVVSSLVFAAAAGATWLFVFGDDPWPPPVEHALVALFGLVFLATWAALVSLAYVAGRQQEAHAGLKRTHLVASVVVTTSLVLLILMHQLRSGNIGGKSATRLCAEYCQGKGFAASGMPPGDTGEDTCSCFDARGRETVHVPIADIRARQRN